MTVVPRRAGCTGMQRSLRNGAGALAMNGLFMTGVLRVKSMLFLGFSVLAAAPALAQDAAVDDGEIIVTASGNRLPIDQSGQPISVIGDAEIKAVQGADIARLLERLPGVSLSRNGGLGGQTGLNLRGGNADQVLVLVDGVRIADYASPGGAYDMGNMLPGTLERVELLRGANSVVWGSQAMAGVLALTTREVDGADLSAEYGAHDTFYGTATAGIAREGHAVSLSGGYARTDGFSARDRGPEADGYRQWQLSGKARAQLADGLSVRAVGRYADSLLELDLTAPDSPLDTQKTREATGRLGLDYEAGKTRLTGGFALSRVRRAYDGGWGPSSFTGSSRRADMAGHLPLPAGFALDFGADSEWTRAKSTFDPKAKARQTSGHALVGRYGAGWSLAAGVRIDDHSRFGTHWTVGGNGTVELAQGLRLRASYGEGFKTPTLYQLFGDQVGNPALQPERSRSYDAGIELGDRNRALHAALTLFRRDSRNLIDLDSSFTYANVARARAQGVEVELGAQVSERFRAQAAYTYTKARDLTNRRDLARRPRHLLTLSTDWRTPLAGLSLGADLRLAGDSVEYDFFGTPAPLDGYVVATLRASLPVSEGVELFGRVENLGDADYQTARGYNTPGRSAYIGARARF